MTCLLDNRNYNRIMGNTTCCSAIQSKSGFDAEIIEPIVKLPNSEIKLKQFMRKHPAIKTVIDEVYTSNSLNLNVNKQKIISASDPVQLSEGTFIGSKSRQLNKREGFGIMLYQNSSYYQGFWQNSFKHGLGVLVDSSGEYFAGQWKKGQPHGYGTYSNCNPYSLYRGNWFQGLKHGFGSEITNQFKYEGNYQYGQRTGQGKITYADGSQYEGQLANSKPNGIGIYRGKGVYYQGSWKEGKMHGTGSSEWFNRNDQLQGKYLGEYREGAKHGYGQYTDEKGVVFKGIWINGDLNGAAPLDVVHPRGSGRIL